MSENQSFLQELEGRSQKLTFDPDDKIVIDRKTFKKIFALLSTCVDQMQENRHCEIFLTSLDNYLNGTDSPEASKCLLLLRYWLDVMPGSFGEMQSWLDEARGVMKLILDAGRMGSDG